MEPGLLFFGCFFLFLFLGVPIVTAIGLTALLFLWQFNLGIQVTAANVYANIAKFPLLAIPFFILAGLDRKSTRLNSSHSQISYTLFFFFNDTAPTEIYTLSLHDALPISGHGRQRLREHRQVPAARDSVLHPGRLRHGPRGPVARAGQPAEPAGRPGAGRPG